MVFISIVIVNLLWCSQTLADIETDTHLVRNDFEEKMQSRSGLCAAIYNFLFYTNQVCKKLNTNERGLLCRHVISYEIYSNQGMSFDEQAFQNRQNNVCKQYKVSVYSMKDNPDPRGGSVQPLGEQRSQSPIKYKTSAYCCPVRLTNGQTGELYLSDGYDRCSAYVHVKENDFLVPQTFVSNIRGLWS